jgi:hypothetical protein
MIMGHSIPTHVHTAGDRHILALRVARLATLTALGFQGEQYASQFLARQMDWLTCLINARDERLTYDLRIISLPRPELYVRGQLTVALLCRMDGVTALQAKEYALELLHLCEAFFEDVGEAAVRV